MWIFSILFLFILTFYLYEKFDLDYYEALPLGLCSLLLLMYVLCFFRALWLVDVLGCGIFLFFITDLLCLHGKFFSVSRSRKFGRSVQLWTVVITVLFLVFFSWHKAIIWWDDINFWATDAKFYYYYGGFAPKYGNVAPEFGDYPPLLSLVKWFFLHCCQSSFQEGLMFAAYYSFHLILLLPLLAHGKRKHSIFYILAVPFLFLVPGIFDFVYVEGNCADVTMGLLYGNLLWAVWQERKDKDIYLYQIMVYGSALILCKSVGIEWMLFSACLCMLLKWVRKNQDKGLAVIKWKTLLLSFTVPLLFQFSWLLFCFLNRRVAKLTGAGVRIVVSGNYAFLEQAKHKSKIFLEGFLKYPMHTDYGPGFDISSAVCFILIIVAAICLWKYRYVSRKEGLLLLGYSCFTAIMAYGIIFLGHITIFAAELQYEDPAVMAMSIARYGAPFSVGMFFLLWNICFAKEDRPNERMLSLFKSGDYKNGKYGMYILFVVTVLLLTNLSAAKEALFSGRNAGLKNQIVTDRKNMIEEEGKRYLDELAKFPELAGKRVLYLREDSTIHWVKDAYISYEASPVSTVYAGIDSSVMNEADVTKRIEESHAAYLYCDDVKGNVSPLFENLMLEGEFLEETFYEIKKGTGGFQLKKKEQ